MKKLLLFILPIFIAVASFGQDLPAKPNKLVSDFANMMSKNEVANLESKLLKFNNEKSTQIAVVTINSLNGSEIGDYSFRLAEAWGVGQEGKDNGVLILVAKNDRKMFIATGYGLEGVIPDATAKNIVEGYMKPDFKNGNFYKGIDDAVTIIMGLSKGEYTASQVNKTRKKSRNLIFPMLFFIVFIVISFARFRRAKSTHLAGSNLNFWTFLLLMNSGNSRGGGGFGDFSSGGGSFGGFGGGSFGGGGAGGSW